MWHSELSHSTDRRMSTEPERILVVDDEVNMLALYEMVLGEEGYEVHTASSGEDALKRLEAEWFDLVISDFMMETMDGIVLLKKLKKIRPDLSFIMVTAHGSIEAAVDAMKTGATDYLTKPVNSEALKLVVQKVLEVSRLTREVEHLRAQFGPNDGFANIVGQSKPMRMLFHHIKIVADSDSTVLIQGESGTGKELVARAIQQHSPRANRPFIAVDCGTLPESLLETELFGHVKGAFTGATAAKKGLFEEAHQGTLFLDEIGTTPLSFQAKLLRVLQEGELRPVGSTRSVKVDVRVLAAANVDLKQECEDGRFRQDLYYRLAVVPLVVPPLRQRRVDIPLLVDHFVKKYCDRRGVEPKRPSAQALQNLVNAPWPGNVRELENVIERAVLFSPGPEIAPEALTTQLPQGGDEAPFQPLPQMPQKTKALVEKTEKDEIQEAMHQAAYNRSRAAKLLGISRSTLYEKLKRYELTDLKAS